MTFDQSGEFHFESTPYKPTGNEQFDRGVKQVIDGTRDAVIGFWNVWKGFTVEPIFEKFDYAIEKRQDGYYISYEDKEEEADVAVSVDNDYRISEVIFTSADTVEKVMPRFINTDQGFLYQGSDLDVNNGVMKTTTTIYYQEIAGLQIPRHVIIQSAILGVQQSIIELSFSNFQVKKKTD